MTQHLHPLDVPEARAGLCQCGCGRTTQRARQTDRRKGWVKGEHVRFIQGHGSKQTWKDRLAADYTVDGNGCWLWQRQMHGAGYGHTQRGGRSQTAHRWYYERFVGPVPEGHHVDHLCGVRRCVNPAHLEAVSPTENVRRSRATKLTATDAATIRASGAPGRVLAQRFGVSPQNITDIRKRRSWSEV